MNPGAEQKWSAPAQEAGAELEIDLREHLKILRKRAWLIGGVTLAALLAGAGFLLVSPKVYRAQSSIIIESSSSRLLGDKTEQVDFAGTDYWSNKDFLETQYKVLASREVLQRVVDKKGLDRDLDFLGVANIEDPDKRAQALEKIVPVEVLSDALRIEPVKNSQLTQITVDDRDPARAAELANAVVEAYVESNLDRRMEGTRAASAWLADQMADLKSKLEASELKLYDFRKENDILSTSLEDRQSILSKRLNTLSESLTQVMSRRAELESAIAEADRAKKESPSDPLWARKLRMVAANQMLSNLRNEYAKLEGEATAIEERYLEKHPARLASQEKLSKLQARIVDEMGTTVASLRSEHRELLGTQASLEQLIEGLKAEAFEVNKREIDQRKLERDQSNNERLYNLVLSRLKDADLAVMMKANNVRLLDAAVAPLKPVKPRPALVLALSLLLGLFGGVGAAYLAEMLDNTLKSEDEIEQVLQVPFLGMLPTLAPAGAKADDRTDDPARDMFVARNPKSAQAEAIRSVRTNVLFMSPDREQRRIMVTSTSPQEGKSSVALNLSVAMAQNGAKVLLIDTDMRRPRLHRAVGVSNERGLSTLLVGEARLEDALKSTEVAGLSLLPCGPVPPNPAEMLHTARFKELLEELGTRFDRIILDSPPLIAAADAAVLSSQVDGVIFVARYKKTTKDLAARMLRSLRDVNAPLLGAVLNDVDLGSQEYGYYSYKRYGYYGDSSSAA
ncbi:GumC family protein [Vulgatibacter incomptus]|uniref:non-specific protein-tyrosine kinase n=1 Tax=Vulgatibacter incomptus TaxID=1391653 RepID=A0A0K1PI53_9BACT|nr:polysaccharide biosynthesis tyrosine autokinase [Vulgatibacter incomptus]AKU93096.1 Tyrosine-protein kinase EpsD [Vulgatibacter incomptus]